MAAYKRGTADHIISKMLCLHIPSLLSFAEGESAAVLLLQPPLLLQTPPPPPSSSPSSSSLLLVEVSSVAQTAAVAGVGLLYQGTAHRLMTEFLLGEIGKRPMSDRIQDREAYTLAAGVALGMVTLGKGSDGGAVGIADLNIEERLHR